MKSVIAAGVLAIAATLTLCPPATAQYQYEKERPYRPPRDKGMYGSGPGDMRPRAPKVEKDEEPVSTAMDEQWKWLLGAVVAGLIGYTLWRFWKEMNRVSHRKRQPWEIE
jgi:hypothetical protein